MGSYMDDKEFGKLIQSVEDIKEDLSEIKALVRAQNGRVRRLEIKCGYMAGIGTILVFGIPLLLRFIF